MPLPLLSGSRYTLFDALSWDEADRIELIRGEAVMMAPPSRRHQEAVMEISAQLHAYLSGRKCKVYPAPFGVRLFEKDGDKPEDVDTLVEPDITVVCDPSKLDDLGCKGAPDLIVEVLSDSTQRHDRIVKFNLYQNAGVQEYWIVDLANRSVQSFILEDGRYSTKLLGVRGDKMKVSVLDSCEIDLSHVFPD